MSTELDKILQDINVLAFQAEFKPNTDENGQPMIITSNCIIPPFNTTPINPVPPTVPVVNKPCSTVFVPEPPIAIPFIELTIPGLECPTGITFTGGIDVVTNGVTTEFPINITPIDNCDYHISGEIDIDFTIPCPLGVTVSGGLAVKVNGTPLDGSHNTVGFTNAIDTCDFTLGGEIDLTIPCQNGMNFDSSQFYILVDDPNGCNSAKHLVNFETGASSTTPNIFVTSGTSFIYSTTAGASWQSGTINSAGSLPMGYEFFGITNNGVNVNGNDKTNDIFVSVGNQNLAAYSTDGITWSWYVTPSGQTMLGVAYGCNFFVSVGLNGTTMNSATGKTFLSWSTHASGTTQNLRFVAFGCSQFVAVGDAGTILVSSNAGVTWTTVASNTTANLQCVGYGGGTFVAVGNGGKIVSSNDCGSTWTQHTVGSANYTCVTHTNSLFYAIASNGTVVSSKDGANWNSSTNNLFTGALAVTSDGNLELVEVGTAGEIETWSQTGSWTYTGNSSYGDRPGISFRPGNVYAGQDTCKLSLYPPLKIQLPFNPCPNGIIIDTTAIPVFDPLNNNIGSATLAFTGTTCHKTLTGSITITSISSSSTSTGGGGGGCSGLPAWLP